MSSYVHSIVWLTQSNRGFIPDSGILRHLNIPKLSNDVRVDSGVIVGDEISSHYDPMISKLIVRGSERTEAIQKLKVALEQYEIAGLATNIEFLKRVCENVSFIAGEVETGFIKKNEDQLLQEVPVPAEIFAQAAIATLIKERELHTGGKPATAVGSSGLMDSLQPRQLQYKTGSMFSAVDQKDICVEVQTVDGETCNVKVDDRVLPSIRSTWDPQSSMLSSYFRHSRYDTRLIFDGDSVTAFSRGAKFTFRVATPKWLEEALGVKDLTHSVLAPMPCKILRVDVEEGEDVKKDQPLVVIESMKMETVIRSPHDGIIARVVHKQGVSGHSSQLSRANKAVGCVQSRYSTCRICRTNRISP